VEPENDDETVAVLQRNSSVGGFGNGRTELPDAQAAPFRMHFGKCLRIGAWARSWLPGPETIRTKSDSQISALAFIDCQLYMTVIHKFRLRFGIRYLASLVGRKN
jgi:hypothetical protein